MNIENLNDHEFAAWAATEAGKLLVKVRGEGLEGKELKDAGDLAAHEFLMDVLARYRPDDAVLSEEEHRGTVGAHDRRTAQRVWIIDPLDGTIMNLRNANGSIYSPLQKYPGGFTPRFFGEIVDYSAAGGIRGDLGGGFGYDVSLRRGNNEIQYTLKNTINPSLGAASPQSFRPGDLINEETQAQADFTKEFDVGFATPLVVGFGLSYLEESYEIVEGELASYQAGPYATPDPFNLCTDVGTPTAAGLLVIVNGSSLNCADVNDPDDDSDSYDPVYQVVGVGSNGFPGYSP